MVCLSNSNKRWENYFAGIPNRSGNPRSPMNAASKVSATNKDDKNCINISFMTILRINNRGGRHEFPSGQSGCPDGFKIKAD
jgi:hypothetical protein